MESEYGLTLEELKEEGYEPRTEDEMKRLFADELWEYLMNNIDYTAIDVEEVKE